MVPPLPPPLQNTTTSTTVAVICPTLPDAAVCRRVNRRSRGYRYLSEELLHLFAIIYHIKTISPIEWGKVKEEHGVAYKDRDVDSIRRKYTIMYQKKVSTGNLAFPPEVRLSKRCKDSIGEKTDLGYGEDGYNMETDKFGGDNEVTDGAV